VPSAHFFSPVQVAQAWVSPAADGQPEQAELVAFAPAPQAPPGHDFAGSSANATAITNAPTSNVKPLIIFNMRTLHLVQG
jgi:hypothetical protein